MLRYYSLMFKASLLLVLGLLAMTLYNAPGTGDFNVWLSWINLLDKQGVYATLVQINDNYPPFSLVLLDVVLHLARWTGFSIFFWLKMSLFAGLFGTSAIVYAWTRNVGLTIGLYLALLVTVGCGYLDVYWSLPFIASLWALQRDRFALATGLYTLSVMTKPQPVLAAPFIALYILNMRSWNDILQPNWRRIGSGLLGGLCVLGTFMAFFGLATFMPLSNAMNTFGNNAYMNMTPSGNAMNVNWILTHLLHVWRPEQFGPLDHGAANMIDSIGIAWQLPFKITFGVLFLFILYRFFRQEKNMCTLMLYSSLGALTCFMLNTGMHENHLYVVPLLTVGLAAMEKRYWGYHMIWMIASVINLVVFYGVGGAGTGYSRVVGIDLAVVCSVIFTCFYCLSLGWLFVPDEAQTDDTTRYKQDQALEKVI